MSEKRSVYRVEVLAHYDGHVFDVAGEVSSVMESVGCEVEVIDAVRRGVVVACAVAFRAAGDESAHEAVRALRSGLRHVGSFDITNLRTGRGRSFRRLS